GRSRLSSLPVHEPERQLVVWAVWCQVHASALASAPRNADRGLYEAVGSRERTLLLQLPRLESLLRGPGRLEAGAAGMRLVTVAVRDQVAHVVGEGVGRTPRS